MIAHLSQLTLMTTLDKPLDVMIEERPPETFEELDADCVYLLVSQCVMGFLDDSESLIYRDNDFVSSIRVVAPKLVVFHEELRTVS